MTQPLDIFAELSLLSGSGVAMSIKANGRVIELEMASLKDGYLIANKLTDRQQRKGILERFQQILAMSDVVLHIRIAKRVIGLLTPHSRPTLLSRLFGIAPVELKPLALFLALVRI